MVQDPYEPDLSNIELSILLWAYQSVIYIYAKAISGYDKLKSTSNVVAQNKKKRKKKSFARWNPLTEWIWRYGGYGLIWRDR